MKRSVLTTSALSFGVLTIACPAALAGTLVWNGMFPRVLGKPVDLKTCLERIDPELAAAISWPRPYVPGLIPTPPEQWVHERELWIGHKPETPKPKLTRLGIELTCTD